MKPVKLGVLGLSNHFLKRVYLPISKSKKIILEGLASRNVKTAQKAFEERSVNKIFNSYENLLADNEIEMVYIPLPNHLHAEWIKKCADAGKHILCEKPLGMSAKEAEEVINYALSRNVKIMEGFMYKLQPQWVKAKEISMSGEIGKVINIETFFGYSNPNPNNIRNVLEFGGGGLMDIGCYAVSCSRFILSKEPTRAISLLQRDPKFKTDILSSAILDFGDARSTFTVGTQVFPSQKVVIYGTSGKIEINIPFNTYQDVPAKITVEIGVGKREIFFDVYDQYGIQFEAFAESIRTDTNTPIPPEDAIRNMKVLDALFESEKSNNWVKI